MPHSKADIARSMYDAYRTKNRALVERILTDDFTFTSPYDDAVDKATYFERCWPNNKLIKTHIVETIIEKGDEVFVLYKCIINEGKEFRNVECLTFEGDHICEVNVYFGAAYKDGKFVKQQ
jgi:ketosteroid isomerase-like protein